MNLVRHRDICNLLVLAVLLLAVLGVTVACEGGPESEPAEVPIAAATPTQTGVWPDTPSPPEPSTPSAHVSLVPRWTASGAPAPTVSPDHAQVQSSSPEPVPSPAPTATPPGEGRSTGEEPTAQTPETGLRIEYHTAGDLASIASGWGHSCGLRADRTVVCWGGDWEGQSTEPDGEFAAIGAFRNYSCGAQASGGVECWGGPPFVVPDEFSGSTELYVSIAAGDSHLCVLESDGGVECWSDPHYGDTDLDHAPNGTFSSLDAGHNHVCGVRADGSVLCWGGEYNEGVVVLPGEQFASVSADHEGYTCGVKVNGTVACWEFRGGEFGNLPAPAGRFESISVEGERACGIRASGALLCWNDLPEWALRGLGMPPEGSFTAISLGDEHACASRDDGTVVCWGKSLGAMPPGGYGINELGMVYSVSAVEEDGVVTYIAVGDQNSCQWREAPQTYHHKFYWGQPGAGGAEPGEPTYRAISVGYLHNCAVTVAGQAVCWGSSQSPGGGGPPPDLRRGQDDPPEGDFLDIAAGNWHTCGLRADGSVVCWGSSHKGQATSPGGEFADITAGDNHTCGLRPGGEVVCWGDLNYYGVRLGPPEGEFVSIASGDNSTCGVRSGGAVECWGGAIPSPRGDFITFEIGGNDACGITTDSMVVCQGWSGSQTHASWVGPLADLSMGGNHSCGIRADGSILCWGGSTIQDTPPGGRFKVVSAGRDRTCALRTDGTAVCWGVTVEEHIGQTTPPSTHPPYFSRVAEWTEQGSVPITPDAPTPSPPLFMRFETASEDGFCGQLCSEDFWYGEFTLEAVQAELDLGADPSLIGDEGATALHWAINRDAGREIIELLLVSGAHPALVDTNGDTVLHRAVANFAGQEVIDLLLEHGADVEARNYTDTPVLTLAVGAGNGPAVIKALLTRGAEVNPGKDTHGETPLSVAVGHAAYGGNSKVIRILLKSGADATEKYYDEEITLLHRYFYYLFGRGSSDSDAFSNPDIVKLLLDHGVDVSVTRESDLFFGGSLLFLALYLAASEPETIRLLLEHGASATTTIEGGYTPLHFVPRIGSAEVAGLLLEYGADVSARTDDGDTPLHGAVLADSVGIVSLLLEHGADVSAQDDRGNTPLLLIARWYEFDAQARASIISLLIEYGADTGLANADGDTPCDLIGPAGDATKWDAALRKAC